MEQARKDNYLLVQKNFDRPYDRKPAPSKIPDAALEFHTTGFGNVKDVSIYTSQYTRPERNGATAPYSKPVCIPSSPSDGLFSNTPDAPAISIVPPPYKSTYVCGMLLPDQRLPCQRRPEPVGKA